MSNNTLSENNSQYQLSTHLQIAISGLSGCGNTTVSKKLAYRLNMPLVNYTFKDIAQELNIPFKEVVEKAKTDFSYDHMVDSRQILLASSQSCILASRLAIWLLKNASLKIYLQASAEERARRIQKREGGDLNEVTAFTKMRDENDSQRYKKLYGIDNTDVSIADVIVDTTNLNPDQIVDSIIKELLKQELIFVNDGSFR